MKKIIFITSEFPPLPGGIGNHAYFLSAYLEKEGYEVTVITNFREVYKDKAFDQDQVFKVVRVKRNAFTYFNRFKVSFSYVGKNEFIIVSGKFSLWIGASLKLFFKSKTILAVLHGSELNAGGKLSRLLTKWSLKKVDKRVAVSTFTKSIALKINPKLSVDVINNGIEIKDTLFVKKDRLKYKKDRLDLVSVGNVTYRKGQQNIIKALPLLKEKYPGIHYHCIGIPTEKKSFEKLAEKLSVTENITFHGVLSEAEKHTLLSDCDVFCMLSSVLKNGDVEGFGIAILEANAIGIPAIGSNNSGIVDAIKNYANGILVNPENKDEIVNALKLILEDYDNYSFRAKEHSKMFQWNIVIQSYVKVLNS